MLLLYFGNRVHRSLPYPPGPRKLPLLGNLLDFPLSFSWETYARWSKDHNSDIIHLRAAGRDFIVLNSLTAATDLLDKKSVIYSGSMGWNWVFSAMPYGERWKQRRRLFQQYFSNRNVASYRIKELKFVRKALCRLLDHPNDLFGIIRHSIGGVAISLAYGLKIRDSNDLFINLAERALQTALEATLPGAFLVDFIPWLKYVPEWMPGAGFQKKARMWKKLQEEMHELPYSEAVKNLASGTADPSLTSNSLEKLDDSLNVEHQEEIIKDTAGIVFAAGTDTTMAAMQTFFAAMLCYPEVQKNAQAELDRVLEGRMPEFDDEPNLPYLSVVIKEVMRWKPVVPLGVPHQVTDDDVYEGYHIPKGAFVIANAWAMLQNEEDYPDPSSFKPERFLTPDGQLNPAVRDPNLMAFGFGRRICPGSNVALSLLWIWIASFLTTFDISNPLDDDGVPVDPSINHPLPFKCTIKPRSKASEELIRSQVHTDI
ncbi:cytochrome P450 [Gymnopilus junonius]|uniref:Cytochrome P450 n=1 Tax=Gymnopilus junonius TaxID=109634 RepID=A0A9P5NY29_GYMJU|nr:cytochrome P450 [Gymnopilus junonius]